MRHFSILTAVLLISAAPVPQDNESDALIAAICRAGGQVHSSVHGANKNRIAINVESVDLSADKALDRQLLKKLVLFPDLRTLTFEEDVTDEFLKELPELPSVEEVKMHTRKTTDSAVWILTQRCSRVRNLQLTGTITDAGLAQAKQFRALEELDCGSLNKVTFKDAGACLRELKLLRTLNLSHSRIDDEGMAGLAGLSELRELNLESTPITDAGIAHLSGLTQLRKLNLMFTKCTAKCLEHLSKCKSLETLIAPPGDFSGPALANLEKCSQLHSLNLGITSTDNDLQLVAEAESLTKLDLVGCRSISDKGVAHLRALKELRDIRLESAQITDEALAALKNCDKLQRVSLSGKGITSAGIKHLESLELLTYLELRSSKIDDDAMQVIARFPRLQVLHVNNTSISDKGLESLSKAKQLQELWLPETRVTDAGVAAIRKAIPGIKVVQ